MLTFNCANHRGEGPMYPKRFLILGDDKSTVLKIALGASQVGMEFRGNKSAAGATLEHSTGTEVLGLTIADAILTIEFERAPAQGEAVEIDLKFYYEGES
jgi:hypothetical protein